MRNYTKPVTPAVKSEIKAAHMANHARCIEELQRTVLPPRKKAKKRDKGTHPFQLIVRSVEGELRLYVWWGVVSVMNWTDYGNGPHIQEVECTFPFGTSVLLGKPGVPLDSEGIGYLVLDSAETYGVWVWLDMNSGSLPSPHTELPSFGVEVINGVTSTCSLLFSTDYHTAYDGPSLSASEGGGAYFFLGQVTGTGGVTQWRRSDIIMPMVALPSDIQFISQDAENILTEGSDGGVFYDPPPVVSADDGNSITTGSDGGAFYVEP